MTKRTSSPSFVRNVQSFSKPFAVAALGLGVASFAITGVRPALAAHPSKTPAQEESVLVATREAPPTDPKTGDAAKGDTLEPTAQSSDHAPELASGSGSEDTGAHFGEALAKVAEPSQQDKAAKPAAEAAAEPEKTSSPIPAPATSGAARRAAAAQAESITYEAVKFQGIAVGKSTKHELITAWGQPADTSSTPEGEVLLYRKSPFQAVEVLVNHDGVVSTIKITLAAPLETKKLSEQLSLDRIEPVTVSDGTDKPFGLAFPERGVMFMFADSEKVTPVDDDKPAAAASATVSHVAIQPLDAHAFALRAEKHVNGPYAQSINDLKTAITLDPEFANAYYLLAKIYLATGQADLADAAAAEACDIEPKNAAFQLCRAQTRELLGEYDDSVLKVRAVLDREDLTAIDRAKRCTRWLASPRWATAKLLRRQFTFETRAIEIADKLATSKDVKERRAAKAVAGRSTRGRRGGNLPPGLQSKGREPVAVGWPRLGFGRGLHLQRRRQRRAATLNLATSSCVVGQFPTDARPGAMGGRGRRSCKNTLSPIRR